VNIVFRVDATKNIGLGHLMRCYALAEELVKNKNTCFFVSNIDCEKIIEKINKSNIILEKISTSPNSKQDIDYLINFSRNNNINWIVTDHYEIHSEYIKTIKDNRFNVLSIDDTAQTYYKSDIVINQNIGSEKLTFHSDRNTRFLLGPKYVMLRDELLKREKKRYINDVEKILVTLGGIDYGNITIKILKLLKEIIDNNIEIIVVIGTLNKIEEDLKSEINTLDNSHFRFVFSPENMAELYLESDIAISAGGSSCYELAYFGIPNIIITVADNQLNIAKELDKLNVSIYLGGKEKFCHSKIKENVLKLINDNSLRKNMAENGRKLVDERGKQRIIEVMNKF
jgi:UDP-2,4-diacetamido-2,4,6-trideoxy-beta-L-altropyranose hydrolase